LTAIILLAGCVGGVFAYIWAFDEAIEMQDSILIQDRQPCAERRHQSDQSLHGVDADAEVMFMELGTAPLARAEDRQHLELSRTACTWRRATVRRVRSRRAMRAVPKFHEHDLCVRINAVK